MTFTFTPASAYRDRHGLFVALVAPTNAGKTYSGLRLARGIAGPNGKIAVLDTEGGRTLHLKQHFDFDVVVMEPPHRPARYLEAARAAQAAGYNALLVDSFSMEWRGIGGVIDWMDEELEAAVERQRANAEARGWEFNEYRARNAAKVASTIKPKMEHKLMFAGMLGLRIPIIFSIRGETTFDPETKKERFKAQCGPGFLFEVTVSFRLASDRKGIVDLSDATSWKMEGAHKAIFKDGDQLSERHGQMLEAWATGKLEAPPPVDDDRAGRRQGAGDFPGDKPSWKPPASLKVALAAIAEMEPLEARVWKVNAEAWLKTIPAKAAASIEGALKQKIGDDEPQPFDDSEDPPAGQTAGDGASAEQPPAEPEQQAA